MSRATPEPTASTGPVLQPYMFERHPAYRGQLELLAELSPRLRINAVFPADSVEHERWAPRSSRIQRAWSHLASRARTYVRAHGDVTCHYFVGDFPVEMQFLIGRARIHIDADDPLNVFGRGGRGLIDGTQWRPLALKMLGAMRKGALTLSFWTETQLRNFLANFRASESRLLVEDGLVRVVPPCIRPWPVPAKVGQASALRCLSIASGKFWHKGIGDAMTAVQRAVEHGQRVELTVVGERIPESWLRFAARYPYYRILGRLTRQELDEVYLQHDLVLFPSHHDTYGWVIVEGKARGLPAIATDFYTRWEIITAGDDGLLIADPFDNPFLSISPVAYAEGFLEPDDRGRVYVHPLLESYVESLSSALVRLGEDRELLRAMGECAYHSTMRHGRFGTEARLARMREALRGIE